MLSKKNNYSKVILLCILFSISILFFVLQPHLSSRIFSWKRQLLLSQFLTRVQNNQSISGQEFWQFREFYSPGIFSKKSDTSFLPVILQRASSSLPMTPITSFHSSLLTSIDGITKISSLGALTKYFDSSQTNILVNTDRLLLAQKNNGWYLIFLLSQQELEKTNGFIEDYGEKKLLTPESKWINITEIRSQ